MYKIPENVIFKLSHVRTTPKNAVAMFAPGQFYGFIPFSKEL